MHSFFILSALCAATIAVPVTHSHKHRSDTYTAWQPAPGSKSSCDKTSDKIIGFYVGPQIESVLTDACRAMMPPCAHPNDTPDDMMCAQVTEWHLDGPQCSTQSANVETLEGNKISGWDVELSVTPAAQPESSPGVFWTAQDCYGYFAHMLEKMEPEGCHTQQGFGMGNITVGGDSSLAGTVFQVKIVAES